MAKNSNSHAPLGVMTTNALLSEMQSVIWQCIAPGMVVGDFDAAYRMMLLFQKISASA